MNFDNPCVDMSRCGIFKYCNYLKYYKTLIDFN